MSKIKLALSQNSKHSDLFTAKRFNLFSFIIKQIKKQNFFCQITFRSTCHWATTLTERHHCKCLNIHLNTYTPEPPSGFQSTQRFAFIACISDCLLCIAEKLRCPFSTDLGGNPVIGPRSQAVFIQVPELVEYLGEVLISLLTVK